MTAARVVSGAAAFGVELKLDPNGDLAFDCHYEPADYAELVIMSRRSPPCSGPNKPRRPSIGTR